MQLELVAVDPQTTEAAAAVLELSQSTAAAEEELALNIEGNGGEWPHRDHYIEEYPY